MTRGGTRPSNRLNPFEIRAELLLAYERNLRIFECLNPFEIRAELLHLFFFHLTLTQEGLNPFEIRAELLLQGCGLFHEISALHRVFRVIGVWGRGFFQRVTPQPENGFLADV